MASLPLHCEVYVGVLFVDEIKENGGIMFTVIKSKMCRPRSDDKIIPLNPCVVPTISFEISENRSER